jgi:hypothetical protein
MKFLNPRQATSLFVSPGTQIDAEWIEKKKMPIDLYSDAASSTLRGHAKLRMNLQEVNRRKRPLVASPRIRSTAAQRGQWQPSRALQRVHPHGMVRARLIDGASTRRCCRRRAPLPSIPTIIGVIAPPPCFRGQTVARTRGWRWCWTPKVYWRVLVVPSTRAYL